MAVRLGGETEFVTFEQTKLLPHEEQPEQFTEVCQEFLDRRLGV